MLPLTIRARASPLQADCMKHFPGAALHILAAVLDSPKTNLADKRLGLWSRYLNARPCLLFWGLVLIMNDAFEEVSNFEGSKYQHQGCDVPHAE